MRKQWIAAILGFVISAQLWASCPPVELVPAQIPPVLTINETYQFTYTLVNHSGNYWPVINITNNNPAVSIGANQCAATGLAPYGSCTFDVIIIPKMLGPLTDLLVVDYGGRSPIQSPINTTVQAPACSVVQLIPATIPPTLTTNESYIFTYTLTNSSASSWTISVTGGSAPVSIGTNQCAAGLNPNSSCTFDVNIVPTVVGPIIDELTINYSSYGSCPPIQTQINTTADVPMSLPFIASGNSFAGGGVVFPIVARSAGEGINWTSQEILYNGNPIEGFLTSSSCTAIISVEPSATCITVGEEGPVTLQGVPLVAVSTDSGYTWTISDYFHNLPYPLNNTQLFSAACTIGVTPGCVTVGQNAPSTGKLYYNSDINASINNWIEPAFPISDFPGILFWVTCSQSGVNDVCLAVGGDYTLGKPKILIGTNNASNWADDPAALTFPNGQLFYVDCNGSGVNLVCVVVGEPSLLAVSNPGLTGWNIISVPNPNTLLSSVSCSGSAVTDVCATVGYDTATTTPYIMVSQNGGQTWTIPAIPGLPANGYFTSVKCTRTGTDVICAAVGSDDTNNMPILVSSSDNGATWTIKTVPGIVPGSGGYYASVACHDNNGIGICAVGGELVSYGVGAPIMVVSADNANTWNLTNVINSPASGIYIEVSG